MGSAFADLWLGKPEDGVTLTYRHDRWELHVHGGRARGVADAGFQWDSVRKTWYTHSPASAAVFAKYGDAAAREARNGALIAHIIRARQSSRVTTSLDIPVPAGKQLYEFQKAGVAFLLGHEKALLADDMGLGKTVQAIALVNAAHDVNNVLIACQLMKLEDWAYECAQWLTRPLAIHTYRSSDVPRHRGGIVIMNYEAVVKHYERLSAIPFDLVIVDESQHIKNARAKRTKAITRLAKKARRAVFLTGTPMLNRPYELWTTLSTLDPGRWTSFPYFFKRYCNSDQRGAAHLLELNEILKTTIMLRRRKDDVLADLPPKTRLIHLVEPTARAHEALAMLDTASFEEALRSGGRTASREQFETMSKARHMLGQEKIPYVIEYAQAVLEGAEKIVIFCHHRDVADEIAAAFGERCVIVHGEIEPGERQRRIQRFREDPGCSVFIGTLAVTGTGLNLQAATHAIFAEIDWVPAILTQAEDRLARIGQKHNVTVHHIVFRNTLDMRIVEAIIEKQGMIRKAIDGATDTLA